MDPSWVMVSSADLELSLQAPEQPPYQWWSAQGNQGKREAKHGWTALHWKKYVDDYSSESATCTLRGCHIKCHSSFESLIVLEMLEVAQVQHRPERGVWIRWSTFEHLRDGGTTGDDRWRQVTDVEVCVHLGRPTFANCCGGWRLETFGNDPIRIGSGLDSMVPCILSPAESTCFVVLISLDSIDYTRLLYCLTKICYTTNCYSIIRGCWLLLDSQFEPVTVMK